jgi:hypothetical protein
MIKTIHKKANASWIRASVCGALFIVIIVFTYVNMRSIVKGVAIEADIIPATENSKVVHVEGFVKNATYVSLNGREIFIDEEGKFNEAVALPDGYSVIAISAKDNNGVTKENTLEVVSKNSGTQVALVGQNIITY